MGRIKININKYKKTKNRIVARCVFLAVKEDTELDQLLNNAVIATGGVKEHIEPFLVKKKGKAAAAEKKA